ncbi:hypothetical protein B0F90DRAFT_1878373 [Multifurca ochricompacta]|uniref:Uncharacterized protein n=1 Tax=Multifurca ochricompacta TaxID=376703 RepID=A0AAD4LTU7_9AGAM|nr:hypothetical protein B0F90DRAFT_1878373 [Multifurca ochricompacta]
MGTVRSPKPIIGIPQLSHFFSRTENLRLLTRAFLNFNCQPCIFFRPTGDEMIGYRHSIWLSWCELTNQQLSFMVQICNQLSPILFKLKAFSIYANSGEQWLQDGTDPVEWLGLFRPFTAVETLYVSKDLGPHVAPALEDLSRDPAMAVLPELRQVQFESSQEISVNQFVTTRHELSGFGHPLTMEYDKNFIWFEVI